jgi:hypothetical protein
VSRPSSPGDEFVPRFYRQYRELAAGFDTPTSADAFILKRIAGVAVAVEDHDTVHRIVHFGGTNDGARWGQNAKKLAPGISKYSLERKCRGFKCPAVLRVVGAEADGKRTVVVVWNGEEHDHSCVYAVAPPMCVPCDAVECFRMFVCREPAGKRDLALITFVREKTECQMKPAQIIAAVCEEFEAYNTLASDKTFRAKVTRMIASAREARFGSATGTNTFGRIAELIGSYGVDLSAPFPFEGFGLHDPLLLTVVVDEAKPLCVLIATTVGLLNNAVEATKYGAPPLLSYLTRAHAYVFLDAPAHLSLGCVFVFVFVQASASKFKKTPRTASSNTAAKSMFTQRPTHSTSVGVSAPASCRGRARPRNCTRKSTKRTAMPSRLLRRTSRLLVCLSASCNQRLATCPMLRTSFQIHAPLCIPAS